MADINKQLKTEMDSLSKSLNNYLTNIKKLSKEKRIPTILRGRLKTLENYWDRYRTIHSILNSDPEASAEREEEDEESTDDPQEALETMEGIYFDTADFINGWIAESQHNTTIQQAEPASHSSTSEPGDQPSGRVSDAIKLPKIEIPQFTGNFLDWTNFHDLFDSLVIKNQSPSDVQRLHYLKCSVSDEANSLLKNVKITEANFRSAWKILTDRYDNKRAIINAHLQVLLSIPNVSNVGNEILKGIKYLRDTANEVLETLKNLERPVEHWDDVIVFILVQRLDKQSRKEWETGLGESSEYPSVKRLNKFLNTRVRTLEALSKHENSSISSQNIPKIRTLEAITKTNNRNQLSATSKNQAGKNFRQPPLKTILSANYKCIVCSQNHKLYHCENFKTMQVIQRDAFVKKHNICQNCLNLGHSTKDCNSKLNCLKCHQRHHTLLHHVPNPSDTISNHINMNLSTDPGGTTPFQFTSFNHSTNSTAIRSILLATARVTIKTNSGQMLNVRALLDQGSESSFVTESIVQRLRLPRQKIYASIEGVGGGQTGTVKSMTQFSIEPCHGQGPAVFARAFVLNKITSYVPKQSAPNCLNLFQNLELADPNPLSTDKFDLLIGADLYGSVLLEGIVQGQTGTPIAQRTIFGWVLSGPLNPNKEPTLSVHVHFCCSTLSDSLKRFWEVEEIPRKPLFTKEEKECEEHFTKTHSRAPDGKYIVRLPFKKLSTPILGKSKGIASKSLEHLERRFQNNHELARAYDDFLTEYDQLGHMDLAPPRDDPDNNRVYLPHHPVIREDSQTTRLRVVFNASCKTTNGSSLNDHLLIGPKLQNELPTILLNFRKFRYVFTADIEKMFRQIWVDPRDRNYQCILWRSSPSNQIETFHLCTVTYGTSTAPYLALRTLKQLAKDEGHKYPLAVPVLSDQVYVDDLLFGADDRALALQTKQQITALLSAGGFHLKKWASSSAELLRDIDPGNHNLALEHPFEKEGGLKVLGIQWIPSSDSFGFQVNLLPFNAKPTKRDVLATIARLFDPLGWVSPVTVKAKIFMQHLWTLKSGWDKPLPKDLLTDWHSYCQQLPSLNELKTTRWIGEGHEVMSREIHGFSDASNSAYAAVVYLKIVTVSGDVKVKLLIAKSKVAPIKTLSIPKLELLAATLLAKLVEYVRDSMNFPSIQTYCWTDSTIVLGWLAKDPSCWKTFVANRTTEIHKRVSNTVWNHIPTEQNPADCASRGINPNSLIGHPLWWTGPSWLTGSKGEWPDQTKLSISTEQEKRVISHVHTSQPKLEWDLMNDISSWPKLQLVTAYVMRFIHKLKSKLNVKLKDESVNHNLALSVEEINSASQFWIKEVQRHQFAKELIRLQNGLPLDKQSSLIRLNPFLDQHGIIRVGGRLRESILNYHQKFPIILPKHRISELIIAQTHKITLHGGIQLMLRVLRERYWIIGARNLVRSHIHYCVPCTRQRAVTSTQFMADLPAVRVSPSRTFSRVGIDYAGPITVRTSLKRGSQSHKAYVALFVCLATRAIHLELVHDYTSAAFLAALDRFTSRRGLPSDIYSDQGTTFQGADKELRQNFYRIIQDPSLLSRLATDKIRWHFLPPSAPHFGGIWEAGVKSVKHHLRRVLGAHTPKIDELSTMLCLIEGCLNSRPIAPLRDDIESVDALTPAHFLVGTTLRTVPEPSYLDLNENRLSRWQLVKTLSERFWQIWTCDYLNSLQQRYKWKQTCKNLQVGDLVLIKNRNLPPSQWDLGRVLECIPGRDNLTRVVKVRTAQTTYTRPITQLCKLHTKV